jgi:hypothetical protein
VIDANQRALPGTTVHEFQPRINEWTLTHIRAFVILFVDGLSLPLHDLDLILRSVSSAGSPRLQSIGWITRFYLSQVDRVWLSSAFWPAGEPF